MKIKVSLHSFQMQIGKVHVYSRKCVFDVKGITCLVYNIFKTKKTYACRLLVMTSSEEQDDILYFLIISALLIIKVK